MSLVRHCRAFKADKLGRYSLFPKELMPVPRAWAEKTGNLVSFAEHDQGGSRPERAIWALTAGVQEDISRQLSTRICWQRMWSSSSMLRGLAEMGVPRW